MISRVSTVIKNNSFATLYLLVIVWLAIGILIYGSELGLKILILHLIVFVTSYYLLKKLINIEKSNKLEVLIINKNIANYSSAFLCFFAIGHWITINKIPFMEALLATDNNEITRIRTTIYENSNYIINYVYSMLTGGVLPVLALFFLVVKSKGKYLFLMLSLIYVGSFIQKAPVLLIGFPIIVYLVIVKKYKFVLFYLSSTILVFVLIHFNLNGYLFQKTKFISSAEASIGVEPKIHDKWYMVEFNGGFKYEVQQR